MGETMPLDVDTLIRLVREEVERRRLEAGTGAGPSQPSSTVEWQPLQEALVAAESAAAVGERLPPMTQWQGARRRLAVPAARVVLRIAQLVTRDQTAFNRLVISLFRMLASTVSDGLAAITTRLDGVADGVARALAQGRGVPELIEAGERTTSEVRALRERVTGVEARNLAAERAVAETVGTCAELRSGLLEHRQAQERRLAELLRSIASLERQVAQGGLPLVRPEEPGAPSAIGAGSGVLSDAFYVSFEDRFRGTRDQVKARVRVYLPLVGDVGAGTRERPVVDIGCGRGEWLEVLRDEGLVARGVDLNGVMVEEGRGRGFDVTQADALAYLRAQADASVGAVTGIHVVEHLGVEAVVALLDECRRVVRPGGLCIFETPNPTNLRVGASQFYIDPTHRTPLHPDTLAFLAEWRGLVDVRILPLHPMDDPVGLEGDGSPVARILREQLFGPQDYALVAACP
jgi:SAM-dependent methyltransferase